MNTKHLQTIILVLFCSNSLFASESYPIKSIPDHLIPYANEVIRVDDRIFAIESSEKGRLEARIVKSILQNEKFSQIVSLSYDSDIKIKKLKLIVYDKNGKVLRKYKEKDFTDVSAIQSFSIYEDSRVKYLDLRSFSTPFTYELEYELKLSGLRFINYPDWMPINFNQSLQKATYTIVVPEGLKIHHLNKNKAPSPEIKYNKKQQTYTWILENHSAVPEEKYSPPSQDILPVVRLSPDYFKVDKFEGSMATWEDFGRFIFNLYDDQQELSQNTKNLVDSIKVNSKSIEEIVRKLFNYMSSNMRYVSVQLGIGGWRPFDANYTETNKYGDCKALSNYMHALLSEAGINSNIVITYLGSNPVKIPENFASSYFNHAILYVPELDWWIDCTKKYLPIEYAGSKNTNRKALLVTPQGGRLAYIPPYEPTETPKKYNITMTVDEEKAVTLSADIRLEGRPQEVYRHVKDLSLEKQREYFLHQLIFPPDELRSFEIIVDSLLPVVNISLTAYYKQLLNQSGDFFTLPVNPLKSEISIPPRDHDRIMPIVIRHKEASLSQVKISFPKKYTITHIDRDGHKSDKNNFGNYDLKWSVEQQTLTTEHKLEINNGTFDNTQYMDWRKFIIDTSNSDVITLALKRT